MIIGSDFSLENGQIRIDGKPIPLPYPVADALVAGDVILVRLNVPIKQAYNRNILAFAKNGVLVWQIQESPHGGNIDKPFMNMKKKENGEVVVGNWNGVDYRVNLNSGDIHVVGFPR